MQIQHRKMVTGMVSLPVNLFQIGEVPGEAQKPANLWSMAWHKNPLNHALLSPLWALLYLKLTLKLDWSVFHHYHQLEKKKKKCIKKKKKGTTPRYTTMHCSHQLPTTNTWCQTSIQKIIISFYSFDNFINLPQ